MRILRISYVKCTLFNLLDEYSFVGMVNVTLQLEQILVNSYNVSHRKMNAFSIVNTLRYVNDNVLCSLLTILTSMSLKCRNEPCVVEHAVFANVRMVIHLDGHVKKKYFTCLVRYAF